MILGNLMAVGSTKQIGDAFRTRRTANCPSGNLKILRATVSFKSIASVRARDQTSALTQKRPSFWPDRTIVAPMMNPIFRALQTR